MNTATPWAITNPNAAEDVEQDEPGVQVHRALHRTVCRAPGHRRALASRAARQVASAARDQPEAEQGAVGCQAPRTAAPTDRGSAEPSRRRTEQSRRTMTRPSAPRPRFDRQRILRASSERILRTRR